MKTVISFDEGCSGNFLAAILTNSEICKYHRIDAPGNILEYSGMPHFGWQGKPHYDWTIKNPELKNLIITHEHDVKKIKEVFGADTVIRIQTITGLFSALYNVFSKKHVLEQQTPVLSSWPENLSLCYDLALEHIKDYYKKFTVSRDYDTAIILDYGYFYNKEKLLDFAKLHNLKITNENLIDEYIARQMPLMLDMPQCKRMEEIVELIPENYFVESPWFACYCIFCFEYINNLSEDKRLWSISHTPFLNKKTLVELSYLYKDLISQISSTQLTSV